MSAERTPSQQTLADGQNSAAPAGLGPALAELATAPLTVLLLVFPAAILLDWFGAGGSWVFLASALAIIPLAAYLGRATENLAVTVGPAIGGLLNATLGNATELILALMALRKGPSMYPLIKASLTGSIIGNVLLVLGASILAGGLFHARQHFNRTAAAMVTTLLALAAVGLVVPALAFHLFRAQPGPLPPAETAVEALSLEIAGVLAVIYLLSLVFMLGSHRRLFDPAETEPDGGQGMMAPEWTPRAASVVLLLSTAGVAWMSELLVGSVDHAAAALGLNHVFIGVIVVAVVGNAAEHSTAILMAVKDKMDLALQIAIGSSLQIALFVVPVLVFSSLLISPALPLDLHFSLFETVAVVLTVAILALVVLDGETHWMEGVMMLGVYLILALAFYHLPESAP
jgi:Ca2+:H+ antiporter